MSPEAIAQKKKKKSSQKSSNRKKISNSLIDYRQKITSTTNQSHFMISESIRKENFINFPFFFNMKKKYF